MLYLQELAAALQVRDFLMNTREDMRIKLSSEQARQIESKINQLNAALLEKSLELDLDKTTLGKNRVRFVQSTEDVEKLLTHFAEPGTVPESDVAAEAKKEKKAKPHALKRTV